MKTISLLLIPTLSFLTEMNVMKGCFEENNTKRQQETELQYHIEGSGDTTLLFIHGWCIKSDYWESQMERFKKDYTVVTFDLPGFHSKTPKQDWTIKAYSQNVLDLIDELNLENVILVGHSMGGDIMLEAALTDQKEIIGLIGVDNFKMVGMEMTEEQEQEMMGFMNMLKEDFKQIATQYADQYLFGPGTAEHVKERIKADFASTIPEAGIESLEDLIGYDKIRGERLKKLDYKLYLINSDGFPTNTAGLNQYCKKGYEILDIHATGHYPMIEKPEEFNELLQEAVWRIGDTYR